MRGITLVLVACLSCVSAVTQLHESGNPKLGDPVALDDLNIYEDHNGGFVYNIQTTASSISGLDQPFSITQVNDTQVVYVFEYLNITGQYAHNGTILFLLPILGDGNYQIHAKNVTITATGQPGAYDMFFFVFEFDATFEKFFGGGLMEVLTQALKLQPIAADVFFKYYRTNIAALINASL